MNINIVAFALLAVTALPTSGFAAMMPDAANQQAMIYSRDASSRFLAGSYMPGQQLSDDGFALVSARPTGRSTDPAPAGGAETSQSVFATSQASSGSALSLSNALDKASRFADAEQNGIASTVIPVGAVAPVSQLSTVPLPASSALFGAALLVLAGLGYGLRGRASEQA